MCGGDPGPFAQAQGHAVPGSGRCLASGDPRVAPHGRANGVGRRRGDRPVPAERLQSPRLPSRLRYADCVHAIYLWCARSGPSTPCSVWVPDRLGHREIATIGALFMGGMLDREVRGRVSSLRCCLRVVACIPICWDVLSRMLGLRASDGFTRSGAGSLIAPGFASWLSPRVDRLADRRTDRLRARRLYHASRRDHVP